MAKHQNKEITILEPCFLIKTSEGEEKMVRAKEVTLDKDELFKFVKGKL